MSKIFRLYKEGTATYQDWNSSPAFPYNSTSRDTIEDPDGASAHREITSIPSPFARIDLIKTAFKEVCKSGKNKQPNLDGNTIFHKMVSDTLDVGEIFFNIDKYDGIVEIIKWDREIMLAELTESNIPGHRYLADALDKYMSSDSETYNFNDLSSIYLLNYVKGNDELNIIGATSPATLFFSNANDLSYVEDIHFGQDKPFDSDYQPLYKRDFKYVKYLFALRNNTSNFANKFPEVNTYLEETFRAITDQDKKNELLNIPSNYLEQLVRISVHGVQQNDYVEVLGIPLYKRGSDSMTTPSDFTIKTTKGFERPPLVLPIEPGNRYEHLLYTTSNWGKTNVAPFVVQESNLNKRKLPCDGSLYPYLTISDFLEDTIIRVPHSLNVNNYFDGNLNIEEKELSYLLPLKPLLFEYFTPEEIRGNMMDGEPMIKMQSRAGRQAVEVTLRIPIRGADNISYVEYTRLYYKDRKANEEKNEGGMTEFKFTGFVMPQVRFNNEEDAIYTISCVQSTKENAEFLFFSHGKKVLPTSKTCRSKDQRMLIKADNYMIEKKNFDFIQVHNINGHHGILLPIFKQQRNDEKFEFAIDLGTSNTHIEFRKGDESPSVFTITAKDRQLCEMFTPIKNEYGSIEDLIEETELIEKDYIPSEIGEGSDFYFPTRTVLSSAKLIEWDKELNPFAYVNIPFTYDKRRELPHNNYTCNIKWAKDDQHEKKMEAYIRCLMLIIRNKVLLNDGDLQKTKVTWFYPISMAPKRLTKMKTVWNDTFKKYFKDGDTEFMTESAAPIQYIFKKYSTAKDLVNIDIGGGTTDVAFAKDGDIKYVTSFRFASNALFEDSISEDNYNNGIIDWYKDHILNLLRENELEELSDVLNSSNNMKPANMASFLFGLNNNKLIKNEEIDVKAVDLNCILQEDEYFKIVFIIFYTAIIYHIAQIIKSLGLEAPRHISFSGNGSKVIRVITTNPEILAQYTQKIFEKLLNKPYGKDLELLGIEKNSNPKETTCKGGIIGKKRADDGIKSIVFKSDCTGMVTGEDTYANIKDDDKNRTVRAVEDFFKFVLDDMNSDFNFHYNFGVKSRSLSIAQEISKKDLLTFLDRGIKQRLDEAEPQNKIEETFFYYPIKGVLNAISERIYKELQQS